MTKAANCWSLSRNAGMATLASCASKAPGRGLHRAFRLHRRRNSQIVLAIASRNYGACVLVRLYAALGDRLKSTFRRLQGPQRIEAVGKLGERGLEGVDSARIGSGVLGLRVMLAGLRGCVERFKAIGLPLCWCLVDWMEDTGAALVAKVGIEPAEDEWMRLIVSLSRFEAFKGVLPERSESSQSVELGSEAVKVRPEFRKCHCGACASG